MSGSFDGCWERIDRAETHRKTIASVWSDFLERQAYVPHVFVSDDGSGNLSVEQVEEIPKQIALEIGEYLYQMRAALDGCVYEAACLASGQRPPPHENQLEFPITATPEGFQRVAWKIEPLAQPQRDIIMAVQPFNEPLNLTPEERPYNFNRGLAILNDWARKDRHRKLHVAASWASHVLPLLAIPPATTLAAFTVVQNRFLFKQGDQIQIATFQIDGWRRGMDLRGNPNLVIDLAVDETPLPCGDMDTLDQRFTCIQYAVGSVLDSVAQSFGVKRFGG